MNSCQHQYKGENHQDSNLNRSLCESWPNDAWAAIPRITRELNKKTYPRLSNVKPAPQVTPVVTDSFANNRIAESSKFQFPRAPSRYLTRQQVYFLNFHFSLKPAKGYLLKAIRPAADGTALCGKGGLETPTFGFGDRRSAS